MTLCPQASKTLIPHQNMDRLNQCTTVNWLRGKGHKVIGAGFTDGMVCFWNIDSESSLLSTDKGETLPYLSFFAHTGPVSGISIYPHPHARFVVTGGNTEKVLNFWDLEQRGQHFITHIGRKGKITKVEWPLCWPSVLASFEELNSSLLAVAPRNFIHQSNMLPQNSSSSDIGSSDWLNYVAQSTTAGEVTIIANNQMLFGMDVDKALKERRALVTRTAISDSVISLNEDGTVECADPADLYYANYGEVSGRGLIFCDTNLDSDKRWPPSSEIAYLSERMEQCCSANYPVTSVNRLAWNPNAASFGWIAVGYQTGLVRLVRMRTKTSDDMLRTYMSS
jgi:WD40 repeat protein